MSDICLSAEGDMDVRQVQSDFPLGTTGFWSKMENVTAQTMFFIRFNAACGFMLRAHL